MLMTWKLWRRLKNPPRQNPWFKRWSTHKLITFKYWGRSIIGIVTVIFLLIILTRSLAGIVLGLFSILAFLVFCLIFSGFVSGLFWCYLIASETADKSRSGTLDQLAVSPQGLLGTLFLLTTACLHRANVFKVIHVITKTLTLTIIAIAVVELVGFMTYYEQWFSYAFLDDVLLLIIIALIFYSDHIQTTVLSSLIGQWAALVWPDTSGRILAILTFATFNFIIYIGGFLLILGALNLINFDGIFPPLFVYFIYFWLIREVFTRFFAYLITRKLNLPRDAWSDLFQFWF
ncbi:hypothetical protein MASR2M15_21570 [Anaerolineales bacterium]